ncbi:hypothetical protein [Nostoc sp. PCC 9305]|uniref:hypothetical protein n=1 Tax=Nostoc sp. PCC 9305 TaxID=296636 RepID=UPI0039C6D4FE
MSTQTNSVTSKKSELLFNELIELTEEEALSNPNWSNWGILLSQEEENCIRGGMSGDKGIQWFENRGIIVHSIEGARKG